jgi:hypothetical protein
MKTPTNNTMKRVLSLSIIGCIVILTSCSKNGGSNNSSNQNDTTPLAGTVDKTDTLNVVAYNVLNYGDGCQANTTTLDGYFKTIIQYAQPDLLS